MRPDQTRRLKPAASRLELLVIATTLCMLLLGAAAVATATRGQSMVVACQSNLRRIGQLSVELANQDSRMIPHRQSTSGERWWRGLGAWDWGGADGRCGYLRSDWHDPTQSLGAQTRPYSRMLYGVPVPPNADFSVFGCPADTGAARIAPGYEPSFGILSPCSDAEADIIFQSMFQAFGTSFQGDFIWYTGEVIDYPNTGLRYGSFMRPYEWMPNPSELVLFAESRFMQAYLGTQEFAAGGAFPDIPATPVAPWHDPAGFNLLLTDGHVINAPVAVAGSLIPLTSFNPNDYPFREAMARGSGWRVDAFPEAFVLERRAGNPLLAPLSQGLMLPRPPEERRGTTP
jgi:hypothetical protein